MKTTKNMELVCNGVVSNTVCSPAIFRDKVTKELYYFDSKIDVLFKLEVRD